ncbi:hypothetical protein [Nonlabens ulvanivorans]|uniref:Uncharacterized protein n=1 Tax=Nonlabens ulvanivorans TaxID=906888 RepID=A0A084JSN2_NONUL|nr:hypothetical protein [Nonlabens ulvanivorans]KEZ91966.1 hypothetical protein IL45_14810 [Nonlabens ulvanivorans]PRX10589.1 hypothetical protein LY02_02891 [Nonlabens ulvanivorans]
MQKKILNCVISSIIIGGVVGLLDFLIFKIYKLFIGIDFTFNQLLGYIFFVMPMWVFISFIFFLIVPVVKNLKYHRILTLSSFIIIVVALPIPLFFKTNNFLDMAENISKLICSISAFIIVLKFKKKALH